MIQSDGILKMFSSLDFIYTNGLYRDICVSQFPILANNLRLLSFQIKRAVTGAAVTTFELIGVNVDDFDLVAEIGLIDIPEFKATVSPPIAAFEQIIYTAAEDMSQTIPNGYYYIHLAEDGNDWYSNPFEVGNFPLTQYGFGAFSDGFSDGFLTEGAVLTSVGDYVIINVVNFKDLNNKIYQFGYQDILVLDSRHTPEINYAKPSQEIVEDDSTGKEVISNIYHQDVILFTFYHTKDVIEFLRQSRLLARITIVDTNQVETIVTQFEVKMITTDIEEIYKAEIRYKENYVNVNKCLQDY